MLIQTEKRMKMDFFCPFSEHRFPMIPRDSHAPHRISCSHTMSQHPTKRVESYSERFLRNWGSRDPYFACFYNKKNWFSYSISGLDRGQVILNFSKTALNSSQPSLWGVKTWYGYIISDGEPGTPGESKGTCALKLVFTCGGLAHRSISVFIINEWTFWLAVETLVSQWGWRHWTRYIYTFISAIISRNTT